MRHSCIFATVSLLAMALAGCGPESTSSDSNFRNPAENVSLSFESFTLRNESGLPETLPRTIFYDFYRGIEPAEGEDDEDIDEVVGKLRERMNLLMGLTPSDDGKRYTHARNPLDFLHEVITSNQVDNFNQGRQLMRDSITAGEGSRYNTPDKDALIRFTETGDVEEGAEPGPDQRWVYTLLDWTSNPQVNKVFRAAQFVAREPEDDDSNPPEVSSALWSGRFNGPDFSVSGYNRPEFSATSLTGRELGDAELRQEFIGDQNDTLSLTGTSGITIDDEEPDCIRIVVNYKNAEVRIFTSRDEEPNNVDEETDESSPNPAHCGNQQNDDEAIFYQAEVIEQRQ
ncbi:hypothetical protein [Marinobacter sp. HL-58]|uniref:hypothetical protein n=1 Tax=Marinobacter sp. HL-58 TaxID=1479237 RepID=UPI000487228C|nr:hypothetical protein [Marinobacter sp. HL-58]KPP96848.1 MAG: hypothetical protein HLUCCO03_03025 [Marinobacter sp. HL-58]